jgi:hypothetical protein
MCEPKTETERYGDRVRVKCGATGRYVGYGLALVVSAQDNDLFLDEATSIAGHPTLPAPSNEALAGAYEALTYAKLRWAHKVQRDGSDDQPA